MNVLDRLHPTFDALSSYADLSDVDGARTRVGGHVTRCEACRDTVAEIRALGDAARGMEVQGAPADLWSRIEAARAKDAAAEARPRETPAPGAEAFRDVPALRPTTHLPSPRRRRFRPTGMLVAAAAVIAAAILVPTSPSNPLQAGATMGTWRFSPARPAPGATVSVRYMPAADERPPRTLLVVAGFARPRGDLTGRTYNGINRLQDSLGVLARQGDGTYAGSIVLPTDFTAAVLRLASPSGTVRSRVMTTEGPVSRTYEAVALLVGGDARGAPSLASLTAALDLWSNRGTAYRVADTLVRYFPSEPIGYAVRRAPASRRLLDGLIAWFTSGERQYLKFDRRFMAEPTVSVDHALAMIAFANRIEEPAEVRKWTLRLAREHPGDPRSLYAYSSMLSGMFSRANTVDSVRAALPLADTLWERNGHRAANEQLLRAASTVHDDAAWHRWALRAVQSGARDGRGDPIGMELATLDDPAVRRAAEPLVRSLLGESCTLPAGKYSLWQDRTDWESWCRAGHGSDYQALSRIARLDGNPARALVLADSALALMSSTVNCLVPGAHVRRGEALLALGDTTAAARELAWGGVFGGWRGDAYRDSVARVLRPVVDSVHWYAAVRASTAEYMACAAKANQSREARRASRKAAELADSLAR